MRNLQRPMWRRKRGREKPPAAAQSVQGGQIHTDPFGRLERLGLMDESENRLFDQIRQAVPIVDAAISKLIRLVGPFSVECDDRQIQKELDLFCRNVQVGPASVGIEQFLCCYLDNLLTYGNAAGEMIPTWGGDGVGALCNIPLKRILVKRGEEPTGMQFYSYPDGVTEQPVEHPERIVFSALNPAAGEVRGRSLLSGLPFVTSILLNIYQSIGQNFERMGNLRFAVTYHPQGNVDGAYAREIAQEMAQQWSQTMDTEQTRDFVAVGDVGIRVIGADNQVIDSQIPVRQMLEQIVAKLGLPPFVLGLSWSTTERMSQQQAEILASELESYRQLLTSVILKVCRYHLALKGLGGEIQVKWKPVSITDEVEQARAQLLQAQARQIEQAMEKKGEGKR